MKDSDLIPKEYESMEILKFIEYERDVIEAAVQEAGRYLDNLYDSCMKTRQYSSMMFAILSAVLAALIGGLIANPDTSQFIMILSGVAANVIPIAVFIKGLFYKRTFQWSGASPDQYLSEENREWVANMKGYKPEIYDQAKFFRLLHLQSLHYQIYLDGEIQKDLTLWYRRGLYATVATYSIWMIVLIVLVFI